MLVGTSFAIYIGFDRYRIYTRAMDVPETVINRIVYLFSYFMGKVRQDIK